MIDNLYLDLAVEIMNTGIDRAPLYNFSGHNTVS